MATNDRTVWVSNSSQRWIASNFSNGLPGNAGASDPDAYFNGQGQASVTQDMDQTGKSFKLITTPEYQGDVGSLGNPLVCSLTGATGSPFNSIRGTGSVYLAPTSSAAVIVNSLNLATALFISSDSTMPLYVKSGHATVMPTGGIELLTVMGIDASVELITIDGSERSPKYLILTSGDITSDRQTPANSLWEVNGGLLTTTEVTYSNTSWLFINGGTVRFEPTGEISTGLQVVLAGGLLDMSRSVHRITFKSLIIGPEAELLDVPGAVGSTVAIVDLRLEYP